MNPKARSSNSLPFFSLNSADFPQRNRLDEWNHLFKHIFELIPPTLDSNFVSETSGYILGNSIYSRGSGSGYVNHRRKEIVAQGKIDSIVLSFSTVPRAQLTDTPKVIPPGDLLFLDHTRSYKFQYLKSNTNTRYLTLNRDLLAGDFPKIDSLHGLHMPAERGQTRLLTHTLMNLEKSLPYADNADGESISVMLGQLVIACLSPEAMRTPNQRLALQEAKRLMIKSFIETNLRSPELGPAFICLHCGISQSRLYALFPDEGGIANYIWSRRLERAAKDLQDSAFAHLSVGEIAENAGFTRHSHFSTAFKRRFGIKAKDWRSSQNQALLSAQKDGPIFLVNLVRQFSSPMRPYPLRTAQPESGPSVSVPAGAPDFYLK